MAAGRALGGFAGEPHVGDRVGTASHTVTESDIRLFADLTGDMHPQHLDDAWARRSIFGERVAHGLLVLALSIGLVEFDPERIVALRRLGDVVFKRPARIGETIRVESSIAAVRPVGPGLALVDLQWEVFGHDDLKLLRGTIEILWRIGDGEQGEGPLLEGEGDLFAGEVYL